MIEHTQPHFQVQQEWFFSPLNLLRKCIHSNSTHTSPQIHTVTRAFGSEAYLGTVFPPGECRLDCTEGTLGGTWLLGGPLP